MDRGSVVLLPGNVRGNGYEGICEVLARKHEPSSSEAPNAISVYTDCSLIGAPNDAPDGVYTVHFEDHQCAVTRRHGSWMLCGDSVRV